MLQTLKQAVADRLVFLRNPYLSIRTRLLRLASYHLAFDHIVLRNGMQLHTDTPEDRATFESIFFEDMYGLLEYSNALVIDIGGHKGYFALYSILRGADKVIILECEPSNVKAINSLIDENGLRDRVKLIPKAASDKDGIAKFLVYATNWSHSFYSRDGKGQPSEIEVETISLSTIINERECGENILVKSNCEGAEIDVFREIPLGIREMYISHHSFASLGAFAFQAHLEKAGFKVTKVSSNSEHSNFHCVRLE